MRLRNTIKMVFATFGTTYKVLLYKLVIYTLIAVAAYFAIAPNFNAILEASKLPDLIKSFGEVIMSFFNDTMAPETAQKVFTQNLGHFNDYLKGNMSDIYIVLILLGLFLILLNFLDNLGIFALGEIVNDHMQSLADRGFVISIFKDLKKALLFSLIEVGTNFVFFASSLAISLAIYILGFDAIGLLAIFFAIIAFITIYALKQAFTTDFMPAIIVDGKTIGEAFKESIKIKKGVFGKTYSNYITLALTIMFMNVSFAICTFFTGLLITIPLSLLIIVAFQCVNYFTVKGKKYFISSDEIIVPKGAKEDLSLVADIDE